MTAVINKIVLGKIHETRGFIVLEMETNRPVQPWPELHFPESRC